MDIWLGVAVGAFIGVFVMVVVVLWVVGIWYIGDLREDRSSGDERPYYFMEVAKGAYRQMQKNRFVLLRIRHDNYIDNRGGEQ